MNNINENTSLSTFSSLIEKFITRIESLKISFPVVVTAIQASGQETQQKFIDFGKSFLPNNIIETEKEIKITIPLEDISNFNQLLKQNACLSLAENILKRNFIVSLVSEFDIYLASLFKLIFFVKPEILNSSDKILTFKNLMEFETIDRARNYIVEKEIDSLLRDSHTEHFKWLEAKLNINTLRNFPNWANFIEITERRNLFVHNNGCISNQYLTVCKENQVNLYNCDLGTRLEVDEEYFNNAYDCIFEVGVKLAHVIWRKLKSEEKELADISLNNLAVRLLAEHNYRLANLIIDFALNEPAINKKISEKTQLMLIINKVQTLKWMGKEPEALKLLIDKDWNMFSDEFKLAKAVLSDNFDEAYKIMIKIENLSKLDYQEWPLFKEFRKSEQFLKGYEEIFQEPFLENFKDAK